MSNHTAPHLRTDARSGRMIADMLIAAAVLGIFPCECNFKSQNA